MAGINYLPNINPGALSDEFTAYMQLVESYLSLYVMTCTPVTVVKYENGFVNVKPVLRKANSTGDVLDITDDDIIYNLPMLKLKANGWVFDFKAQEGDYGLLLSTKYDISEYKKAHEESNIGSRRMFSTGFYLPLDWTTTDNNGLTLSKGNTSVSLEENTITIKGATVNVEADTVNLGGDGGLGVARIGDSVEDGKITTGSSKVKAG